MKLIIAEKPSVAMDYAKAFGKPQKYDGYVKSGEYTITFAVGHLLEIDDSNAPQKWSLDTLPIIPDEFKYRQIKRVYKQFKIVKSLIQKASEIWIGSDAGREGELLARLILIHSGWKNWDKTYRIWTSEALTKNVIQREVKAKKPAKNWDSLFYCGLARQHADWLVGINLTRALTVKVNDGSVWSIGRVQTPVLRLIVERDLEIKNFKPQPYWQLEALFEKDGQKFKAKLLNENDTISKDRNKVWNVFNAIKDKNNAVVKEITKKRHKAYSPPLFSITTLQMTANKRYGFTAQKTLNLAQDLYEAKYISYPRTESNYLDENQSTKDMVKNILKMLGSESLIPNVDKAGKRVFDNSKLTDHYAIIPMKLLTEENAKKEGLSEDHLKVYNLIKNRFLAVFMPPYEYETTKVILQIDDYLFTASGKVELSLGYKNVERDEDDKKENPLPKLEKGELVNKISQKVIEDQTKPPQHYTESTLLNKMKQLELGTGATRASIIQTLKDRFYIKNKGKSLTATEKGFALIEKVKDREFASVEMTSKWEKSLEKIYTQKLNKKGYIEFLNSIKEFTIKEVEEMKKTDFTYEVKSFGSCPKCGGFLRESAKFVKCDCGFILWKEVAGKKLSEKNLKALIDGKTIYVEGLKAKSGKKFNAGIKLNIETGKLEFVFDESKYDNVMRCSCGNVIISNDKGYFCRNCNKVVWKEIAGKKISNKIAEKLFNGKKVKVKGFKSKSGKTFDAYLFIDETGKPKMQF